VSGTHRDLSGFADVEGNLLLRLVFVALYLAGPVYGLW